MSKMEGQYRRFVIAGVTRLLVVFLALGSSPIWASVWCENQTEGVKEFVSALGEGDCELLVEKVAKENEFGIYLRAGQKGKVLDLKPIGELTDLKSLSLLSEHTLENFTDIYALPLQRLSININDWHGSLCREKGLSNLEYLSLSGPLSAIQDVIGCLQNPQRVKELELKISDKPSSLNLQFLAGHSKLESLSLKCQEAAGTSLMLESLTANRNLEKLTVWYCSNLGDLQDLPRLRKLSWHGAEITSISFLSEFLTRANNLDELEITSSPNLEDVSAISNLSKDFSGRLSLAWNGKLADEQLKHLSHLTKLAFLFLNNTHIKGPGIRYLAPLVNLATLDLDECFIDDEGLKNFESWPSESNLKHLRLMINYANNLTGKTAGSLRHLENLSALLLSNNQVNDEGVRVIAASMPALTDLNLSNNPEISPKSLSYLSELKRLKVVTLGGTAIESDSESFQQFKSACPDLKVFGVQPSIKSALEPLRSLGCTGTMDCNRKLSDDDFELFLPFCDKDLIETLHLMSNSLSGDGLQLLAFSGCGEWSSVKEVVLADNPVDNDSLKYLRIFRNIEALNIDEVKDANGDFLKAAQFGAYSKLNTLLARGTQFTDKNALLLLDLPSFEAFLLNENLLKASTIEKLEAKYVNISKPVWDERRVAYEAKHARPCMKQVDEETRALRIANAANLGLVNSEAAKFMLASSLMPIVTDFDGENTISACDVAPAARLKYEL